MWIRIGIRLAFSITIILFVSFQHVAGHCFVSVFFVLLLLFSSVCSSIWPKCLHWQFEKKKQKVIKEDRTSQWEYNASNLGSMGIIFEDEEAKQREIENTNLFFGFYRFLFFLFVSGEDVGYQFLYSILVVSRTCYIRIILASNSFPKEIFYFFFCFAAIALFRRL